MADVFKICSWLIKTGIVSNKPISNISLQKLLYFSQGLYLAKTNGSKLFENKIYAWEWGPVVKDVYHSFKAFGNNSITKGNYASHLDFRFLEHGISIEESQRAFLESV